jgi:SAM-dependent methyltransferase
MKDYLYLHLRDLPYFRALLRSVEATYYQDLDFPGPILDVGCGDGHFSQLTFNHPIDIGLDPWHAPIQEAGRRGHYTLLVEASGSGMPFPDGCIGSAYSNSVLEHIPDINRVLEDLARVLKPGAPFYFCVPNQNFLPTLSIARFFNRIGLRNLARAYQRFFNRISRHHHCDDPETWRDRLDQAGFRIDRWWHYFPARSLHVLEWGHYFGLPALVSKKLFGRWILAPYRWNLSLTHHYVRKYADASPCEEGVYTFYMARRKTGSEKG